MAKQTMTRRQKDISRLFREHKQAHSSKLRSQTRRQSHFKKGANK